MLRRFLANSLKSLLWYRYPLLVNKGNNRQHLTYVKGKKNMLEVDFNNVWQEERLKIKNNEWRVIDTAGNNIYEKETPILFMLPGTQGTPHIFHNQLQKLQKSTRIISVGYPPIPSAHALAEEFHHLVDHYKLGKINILGSSLGAYIAQLFTLSCPERINMVFLGNAMVDARPLVARRMPSNEFKKLTDDEVLQSVLKRISSFPETDEGFLTAKNFLRKTVTELMTKEELKARFLALDNCGLLPKMSISANQIVIIETADDFVVPEESRKQLKETYSNAAIHTLSAGGHFPYLTRPEAYTDILHKHLDKNLISMPRKARL